MYLSGIGLQNQTVVLIQVKTGSKLMTALKTIIIFLNINYSIRIVAERTLPNYINNYGSL